MGELWGIFRKLYDEKWPWYIESALYCTAGCNTHFEPIGPQEISMKFRWWIFKLIFVIEGWGYSCEIAMGWMSQDPIDDKSILVQVMRWCRQATSHYPSQCWPSSLLPYGVSRSQWVNLLIILMMGMLVSMWIWLRTGFGIEMFVGILLTVGIQWHIRHISSTDSRTYIMQIGQVFNPFDYSLWQRLLTFPCHSYLLI